MSHDVKTYPLLYRPAGLSSVSDTARPEYVCVGTAEMDRGLIFAERTERDLHPSRPCPPTSTRPALRARVEQTIYWGQASETYRH